MIEKAVELLKGLAETARRVELDAVRADLFSQLIEIQQHVLDAQNQIARLNGTIEARDQEIADLRAALDDFSRYELTEIAPGRYAWALKPDDQTGEPQHWLCTACKSQGAKAILQFKKQEPGLDTYACHRCRATLTVPNDIEPAMPMTGGRLRSADIDDVL